MGVQNIADYESKGYVVEPAFAISYRDKNGNHDLVYDTDPAKSHYTYEFLNNKQPGTASLIIKGTGREIDGLAFTGSKTTTFRINGITLNKKNTTISGTTAFSYTGSEIDPTTVTGFSFKYGDKTLVKGKDYTVSFIGNKVNAGRVTMRFNGAGIYTGMVTSFYTIDKLSLKDAACKIYNGASEWNENTASFRYTANGTTPAFTVRYDGKTVDPSNYMVRYANNRAAKEVSVL